VPPLRVADRHLPGVQGAEPDRPAPARRAPLDGRQAHGILDIPLTSLSTFVLLMSSLGMVLALAAGAAGRPQGRHHLALRHGVPGARLPGLQAYEFNHFYHAGLTLQTNLFGSTFFLLTGFHGAHVLVGVIYLSTLGMLAVRNELGPERSMSVEIAGLYWHFVDVIWIVIFALVYLIK
jgi:cytochrome c oxidase subunit 3/cytochrome o ubiquinol oxidase subunit 3